MKQYDIIIIGAGPVGLYLASMLKQFDVLVLEEHKQLGKKACSGIVSTNIEEFFAVEELKNSVEREIRGIDIISRQGSKIRIEKPGKLGYVINREKFEKKILEGLKKNILVNLGKDNTTQLRKNKVMFGVRAEKISIEKNRVTVKTKYKSFSAKILIGCDGANSIVARAIGHKSREIVLGLTATVQKPDYSEFAEVYLDKGIVSDGFLWKIPRGKTTEYGMMSKNARFETLEKFFKIKNYVKNAAPIPIGTPGKTYSDRALLVGDSAGQIKPWTGGGIIYGMTAARVASDVITEAMIRNDFSGEFLEKYQTEWKKALGKNISRGLLLQNIFKRMNNFEIEILMKLVKILRINFGKGDYDFPF